METESRNMAALVVLMAISLLIWILLGVTDGYLPQLVEHCHG